jgi:hypothetical protein
MPSSISSAVSSTASIVTLLSMVLIKAFILSPLFDLV